MTHLPTSSALSNDGAVSRDRGDAYAVTKHGNTSTGDSIHACTISVLDANDDSTRLEVLESGDALKPVGEALEANAVEDWVVLKFGEELFGVK